MIMCNKQLHTHLPLAISPPVRVSARGGVSTLRGRATWRTVAGGRLPGAGRGRHAPLRRGCGFESPHHVAGLVVVEGITGVEVTVLHVGRRQAGGREAEPRRRNTEVHGGQNLIVENDEKCSRHQNYLMLATSTLQHSPCF